MKTYYFDRLSIEMPDDAVSDCSHQGRCDDDVAHWVRSGQIKFNGTPENSRRELAEYGAWDDEELADDDQNLHRILWIAAGNIQEEERSHKACH